jgi:RNA polymerase sigma-70 factor (subfamily 1)
MRIVWSLKVMSHDDEEQRDVEAIVAKLRTGDSNALAEFINARRPQLMAFIDRRLGAGLRRKVEPDDLFQEVSTEAIRSLREIDLAERDPFNWLCQVAERRIIDAHRRFFGSQKRDAGREVSLNAGGGGSTSTSRPGLINLLVASMTSASQAFSRDQKQMRLLAALEKLPEEHREALRLRYIDGLPSKEIADKLGKTDGAIRVMLTRSLAKLQQILGDEAAG